MSSREKILNRLRGVVAPLPWQPHGWQPWRGESDETRRARFCTTIRAAHAELLTVTEATLADRLAVWLEQEEMEHLVIGRGGRWESAVQRACIGRDVLTPNGPFEQWKEFLFETCQVGITHTLGAIADTGTLLLWPDGGEPRTLSLVPPCHIALLAASAIADNFSDRIAEGRWQQGMPTNLLLISGPSKTADIQRTLAYGAHGPSRLLVVLIEDC